MMIPPEIPREAGLVIAVLIGIGFGFVLERSGFGRADKLAAQFYFRDMTVFKVMFTAIVTAMLGLVAASQLGLTDLRATSESIASWTWIWPMLAGGFVLGVGFIVSGYCPGTSLVAAASGNVDGMVTVAGVVTGTFVYTNLLKIPAFAHFHESGEKGAWFLYDLIPVSPALIAVAIAIMAVLAFIGAEKVESMIAGEAPRRNWRRTLPAFASLAVLIGVGLLIPHTARATEPVKTKIAAADLARRVVAEPWRYSIENNVATDVAQKTTYAIEGKFALPTGSVERSAPRPAASGAPIAPRPKKKGGGCSS